MKYLNEVTRKQNPTDTESMELNFMLKGTENTETRTYGTNESDLKTTHSKTKNRNVKNKCAIVKT